MALTLTPTVRLIKVKEHEELLNCIKRYQERKIVNYETINKRILSLELKQVGRILSITDRFRQNIKLTLCPNEGADHELKDLFFDEVTPVVEET